VREKSGTGQTDPVAEMDLRERTRVCADWCNSLSGFPSVT
jgi:hypothetical protein